MGSGQLGLLNAKQNLLPKIIDISKLSFIPSAFYDKRMQMRGKTKGDKIHDERLYVICDHLFHRTRRETGTA